MEKNNYKISFQGLTGEILDHQLFSVHYVLEHKAENQPHIIKKLTVPSSAEAENDNTNIEIKGIRARKYYHLSTFSSFDRYHNKAPDLVGIQGLINPDLALWDSFVKKSKWIKNHPRLKNVPYEEIHNDNFNYKYKYNHKVRREMLKAFHDYVIVKEFIFGGNDGDYPFPDCTIQYLLKKLDPDELYYKVHSDGVYITKTRKFDDNPYISTFYEVRGLETIILESGIQNIGELSFSNLENVSTVELPETITKIEDAAFYNCPNLRTVVFPSSIKQIGRFIFERSGIQSFTWPELAEFHKIPKCTFKNSSLQHIQLNESVNKIEDEAFRSCKDLEEIQLPDSITSIGKESFCGCTSLKSIYLPDHLAHLGPSAFKGCSSLCEIWLPKSWGDYPAGEEKVIDDSWFKDCPNLKIIHCPRSVIWKSLPNENVQFDYY